MAKKYFLNVTYIHVHLENSSSFCSSLNQFSNEIRLIKAKNREKSSECLMRTCRVFDRDFTHLGEKKTLFWTKQIPCGFYQSFGRSRTTKTTKKRSKGTMHKPQFKIKMNEIKKRRDFFCNICVWILWATRSPHFRIVYLVVREFHVVLKKISQLFSKTKFASNFVE